MKSKFGERVAERSARWCEEVGKKNDHRLLLHRILRNLVRWEIGNH